MATDYAAKIETLEEALLGGVLTVMINGRTVTYRSKDEIIAAINYCRECLGQVPGTVYTQVKRG